MFTADYFITKLGLEAHVEGGYFKELYRNAHTISDSGLPMKFEGKRPLSTTIYYLLQSGQVSKFHRLKFDELWFYHYGSPLLVHMIDSNGNLKSAKLGLNVENGEIPQIVVPSNSVFGAEVVDNDSFGLVSCMVSPGFDYRDFELFTAKTLIKLYPEHEKIIARLNGN
jgi:predicted cupin superfamily sugar epimerase